MKNVIFSLVFAVMAQTAIFTAGCSTNPKYVEGTETAVGLYVPGDGNLYGLQVLHYLNGCIVRASSNQSFYVEREYSSTNSYFYLVNTIENTKTRVTVNGKDEKSEER